MSFVDATAIGTTALALPGVEVIDGYGLTRIRRGDLTISAIPWARSDADFINAIESLTPEPGRKNLLILHCGLADLPELSAGEHGTARRGAGRAGAKRVRSPHALARDAVEGGRADRALPADPRVAPRRIVADNKNVVGRARQGGRGLDGSGGVNRGHRLKGGQQGNGNHGDPPQVWRGREGR